VNFGGNPASSLTCDNQTGFFYFLALAATLFSNAEHGGNMHN
jgi:hypothetical protein